MKIDTARIRRLARERGLTLGAVLARAGVSRTAYYSLSRRPTVLPRSIHALACELGVPVSEILEEIPAALLEARRICDAHPEASFENVWHTLALLDLTPTERLNRSLTRGRAGAVH